ncbi:hypothetical protein AC578_7847 [Pseudocercospora eumusae]|uniref:BTB domain-containing protein n=1 Tax=Pseudocercospora eumusae TaxID=321146 RepID=A0A139HJ65_9PEZI|nr:hypothetical protein AC578_7847 [Pseudocercospora eumusae]KXT02443.1 hypothetical protein AC578_7847 [Pseudocercospora eumusae]
MSTTQNSNIEVIAPDGDFIIKAGGQNGAQFKVSSTCLRAVNIALRSHLDLYLPLQPQGSREINFPKDHPDATREMLQMLHLRPSSAQVNVWPASKIREFAGTLKRYDLVHHLRYQAHAILLEWFRNSDTESSPIVCGDIVAAAYLLDHKAAFLRATRQLMRLCPGDLKDLAMEQCGLSLPIKVLSQLEASREAAYDCVTYAMRGLLGDICKECAVVEYNVVFEHARRQFEPEVWPPSLSGDDAVSLQAIIDKTKTFPKLSVETGCMKHRHEKIVDFEGQAAQAERLSNGLCLACVQAFKVGSSADCNDPAHLD